MFPTRSPETSSQFSMMKSSRAPTIPPSNAAKVISYAQSPGFPHSRSRRATSAPAARNARAKQIPKVCSVSGPMSISGCTGR
jgi:hypothetical protein